MKKTKVMSYIIDWLAHVAGEWHLSSLSLEIRSMATGKSTIFRLFNRILASRVTSSPAMQKPTVWSWHSLTSEETVVRAVHRLPQCSCYCSCKLAPVFDVR